MKLLSRNSFDTSHYHHLLPQTNFSPSISLVSISLTGISRHQNEHVTFTSRPTVSLCSMQCGLLSPIALPQTCRGSVFFSSSHMMWDHMDCISTRTSLLNTPPFTLCPWPPQQSLSITIEMTFSTWPWTPLGPSSNSAWERKGAAWDRKGTGRGHVFKRMT